MFLLTGKFNGFIFIEIQKIIAMHLNWLRTRTVPKGSLQENYEQVDSCAGKIVRILVTIA